jgi:hypothetical protein
MATQYKLDWEACLKVAKHIYYWDGIHSEDREDFIQDVYLEMMVRAQRDGGSLSDKQIWLAARCVRNRYWRAYKKKVLSLSTPIKDTTIELGETIADKASDLSNVLDAKFELEQLPPYVKKLAKKIAKDNPLTKKQTLYLSRFRKGKTKPNPRDLYHERRALGLCVKCGKESGNFARCPECREKMRISQKKYKRRKGLAWQRTLRRYWRKHGRCPKCGGIPEPGHKVCPACLAKNREYLRRHRERLKN